MPKVYNIKSIFQFVVSEHKCNKYCVGTAHYLIVPTLIITTLESGISVDLTSIKFWIFFLKTTMPCGMCHNSSIFPLL